MHDEDQPPLTEPIIIPIVFANGVTVDRVDGVLTLTFWSTHDDPPERRIIIRVALPTEISRALWRQIKKVLGHEH